MHMEGFESGHDPIEAKRAQIARAREARNGFPDTEIATVSEVVLAEHEYIRFKTESGSSYHIQRQEDGSGKLVKEETGEVATITPDEMETLSVTKNEQFVLESGARTTRVETIFEME